MLLSAVIDHRLTPTIADQRFDKFHLAALYLCQAGRVDCKVYKHVFNDLREYTDAFAVSFSHGL